MDELIDPVLRRDLPLEHALNVNMLWYKVSLFRAACRIPFSINTPVTPNRGYRTEEMHRQVYSKINANRVSTGLMPVQTPSKSMHLFGAACDIADPQERIQMWVRAHEDWVRKMGIWFESFRSTPTWVHMQIYPPASGPEDIYFIP